LWSYTPMRRTPAGPDSQTPSDEELVSATLRGDRQAYRTLVERYQARIFSMAYDVVRNKEDAEDVTQESFVKAFLSLDKFKGQSSFYTWLYRIAFNMAVDVRRKTSRRGGNHLEYKETLSVSPSGRPDGTGESEQVSTLQSIEGPHEALVRKQAARKIHEVLAKLSEEHRAVITLREIDGLNYDEISEALGIPKGTVMSRLFYARKALQKALGEFAPESVSQSADGDSHDDSDSQQSDKEQKERLKRNMG
jgi:RNA polymerase sigma-70 factor (ECF subfamily)